MREFIEIAFHKGDLDKEGATLRMGEMRVLTKAFAELNGGQYSEDKASYAALVPVKNLKDGDARAFKDDVMSKVDVVGYFSDAEMDKKAKKVIELAKEKGCSLTLDYIRNRVAHYIMDKFYSERTWKI